MSQILERIEVLESEKTELEEQVNKLQGQIQVWANRQSTLLVTLQQKIGAINELKALAGVKEAEIPEPEENREPQS